MVKQYDIWSDIYQILQKCNKYVQDTSNTVKLDAEMQLCVGKCKNVIFENLYGPHQSWENEFIPYDPIFFNTFVCCRISWKPCTQNYAKIYKIPSGGGGGRPKLGVTLPYIDIQSCEARCICQGRPGPPKKIVFYWINYMLMQLGTWSRKTVFFSWNQEHDGALSYILTQKYTMSSQNPLRSR